MEEIIIRLDDKMPHAMNGFVVMDANGDYNVFINGRLCPKKQQEALEHELSHISRGDLAHRHRVPATLIETLRRKT